MENDSKRATDLETVDRRLKGKKQTTEMEAMAYHTPAAGMSSGEQQLPNNDHCTEYSLLSNTRNHHVEIYVPNDYEVGEIFGQCRYLCSQFTGRLKTSMSP